MKRSAIIPRTLFTQLQSHLFSTPQVEHEAFMLAGWTRSKGLRILVRKLIPIFSKDLEYEGNSGLVLRDEKKVEIMTQCKAESACLVEVHTHPFSKDSVSFSKYDESNLKNFVKYVSIRLPATPFSAMVWGTSSICALVWDEGQEAKPLDEIAIHGSPMQKIFPVNSNKSSYGRDSPDIPVTHDRQVRAFGRSGQKSIGAFTVGIVGAGGIGSHVLQQLAHLGIRAVILIDDDKLDETSMNRLVGASTKDVGKYKSAILSKNAKRINPKLKIWSKPMNLRSPEALDLLQSVDLIFGCVDNDGARLVLAELSAANMIPYIDAATSISIRGNKMVDAGGRVSVYLPLETSCLWCCRQIDTDEASFDLATEDEKKVRVRYGYFNIPEPAPSVVSINGVIASLAINEYLAVVTGFRIPVNLRYDLQTSKVVQQKWSVEESCTICKRCFGLGDMTNIKRYVLAKHDVQEQQTPRLVTHQSGH